MSIDNLITEIVTEIVTTEDTVTEIVTSVEQGPPGPPGSIGIDGLQGIQGEKGDVGGTYEHLQLVNSDSWIVNHNLGFRPNVSVLSVGGREMFAEVIHTSLNQVIIYFDEPRDGIATCT